MTIPGRIRIHFLPALVTVALLLASISPASAEGNLEEIIKRGTLRVGVSTFVPWAMRDKSGNLIGFEIDVATRVAQDMGVEVDFVPTAWNEIIPLLLAKEFDVIISGLSITPQRSRMVSFTIPYAHSGQQMAASMKLAGDFTRRDDFNSPDVTIACRLGATPCDAARALFPRATVRHFDEDVQAFQAVVDGNAHAMISSAPQPRFWAEAYPEKIFLPFGGENLTQNDEAFALRKEDTDALDFFSNWIRVNTDNGWLKQTHNYWFKDQSGWQELIAPN